MNRGHVPIPVGRWAASVLFFLYTCHPCAFGQRTGNPLSGTMPSVVPLVNVGGAVSALDLAAPAKAISEFNRATGLLRGQHSEEAIAHLQKAIADYPKFISAHNYLGLAYLDADDVRRAQSEFEIAANLDDKFPGSFVNLGRLGYHARTEASAH